MFGSQSRQVRKAESTQKGDRATHSQDKYRQGSRGEVVEVGEPWGPLRGDISRLIGRRYTSILGIFS